MRGRRKRVHRGLLASGLRLWLDSLQTYPTHFHPEQSLKPMTKCHAVLILVKCSVQLWGENKLSLVFENCFWRQLCIICGVT